MKPRLTVPAGGSIVRLMDWKRLIISCAAGVLASFANPAASQEASVGEYQPSGPWTVDYAEDSCALLRSFADGDNEVFLEIRRIAPVGQSRFMLGSSDLELTDRDPHITIYPDREPFERSLQSITNDDRSFRAFITTISIDDLQAGPNRVWNGPPVSDWEPVEYPAIRGIQIASVFDQTVRLHTGEMDAPLEALDTCMDDLVRTWGVEPEVLERIATGPQPVNEQRWRMRVAQHYPRRAMRRSRNTSFPVTLLGRTGWQSCTMPLTQRVG